MVLPEVGGVAVEPEDFADYKKQKTFTIQHRSDGVLTELRPRSR